jgi:Cu/Ag efflux protein CusF
MKSFAGLLTLMVLAVALIATPAVAASTHHATGDVKAVNQDAKTFTLAEHKMLRGHKDVTFRVNDPALLANLKTGERVRVNYNKQGKELTAISIEPATKTARAK